MLTTVWQYQKLLVLSYMLCWHFKLKNLTNHCISTLLWLLVLFLINYYDCYEINQYFYNYD